MHTDSGAKHQVAQRVVGHRHLARQIASGFVARLPRWVDADDVVAAADLGLVEAATRFVADYGVPFGAYARVRIAGRVRDELRARDPLSRLARQRLTRLRATAELLSATRQCTVTVGEVAATDGQVHAELYAVAGLTPVELAEDALESAGVAPVEEVVLARERVRFVTVAVLALPAPLARVVPCGEPAPPLRTLANKYGVSVSTVSRQRAVAFAWLKAAVAFYDGVPVVVNTPDASPLQRYLCKVTTAAAVLP